MFRFVLMLLAAACCQPVQAAIDMDLAAQIHEAAAVREQVRASLPAMPARIRDMFKAETRQPLTEEQLQAIQDAAERGFRIDVFEPASISTLAANLEPAAAMKILAFLGSDLGLRMVASDKALALLDEPTVDKVMTGDVTVPGSVARDALFKRLEVAARSTESTVQIFTSMSRAVAIGTAIGTGADLPAQDERALRAAAIMRTDLENGMREPLRRYMTYGYRDLSDADLKKLLSFLESKLGRSYVTAYTHAMGAGFDAMGKRCGEHLGGTLRELSVARSQAQAPTPEQR